MSQYNFNEFSFIYSDGFFRKLRAGNGTEILRGLIPLVRDKNWGTVPMKLVSSNIDHAADRFSVNCQIEYSGENILFSALVDITFYAEGKIVALFSGEAGSSFLKNRIGWNLLLPVEGLSGCHVTALHPNGNTTDAVFPVSIMPHQPLADIQSLSWTDLSGNSIKVNFFGDIFEMEDHRNWTDASYKIYSTPLHQPFPVLIKKGDLINQRIEIQIDNADYIKPVSKKMSLVISDNSSYSLPLIGLGAGSECEVLNEEELAALRELKIDFSGLQCDLTQNNWTDKLHNHLQNCSALKIKAAIFFITDQNFSDTRSLISLLTEFREVLNYICLFDKFSYLTSGRLIDSLISDLRINFPEVEVGGGTYAYFTELNRAVDLSANLDFITFSISPQVHGFDDLTLLENLKGIGYVVHNASVSHKIEVMINALTLKQRLNFVAADETVQNPVATTPGDAVDIRQPSDFAALWTLGAFSNLIFTGAKGVNIFETIGQRGVMQSAHPLPGFGLFTEEPLLKYPVFYIIKELCQLKKAKFRIIESSDEEAVHGLVVEEEKQLQVWIWNYSSEMQYVDINIDLSEMEAGVMDFETGQWKNRIADYSLESRSFNRFRLSGGI